VSSRLRTSIFFRAHTAGHFDEAVGSNQPSRVCQSSVGARSASSRCGRATRALHRARENEGPFPRLLLERGRHERRVEKRHDRAANRPTCSSQMSRRFRKALEYSVENDGSPLPRSTSAGNVVSAARAHTTVLEAKACTQVRSTAAVVTIF